MSETIVIFRTHLLGPRVLDLAAALQVPGEYRVVFAADESAGPVDTGPYDKISLTREHFAALGLLEDVDDIFWRAGDYAFYCAQHRYPDAARFWLVEYDIAINRADPVSFLREIDAASHHDLLSTHFREPEHWWFFAEPLRHLYPTVMRCFYPLVRLSARAVAYAHSERVRLTDLHRAIPKHDRPTWPNDEAFTATALYNGGFACADFLELGDYYSQDTFWWTPTRHPDHLPFQDGLLYHPVRDGAHYLKVVRESGAVDPPADPRTLLELYPDLDRQSLFELKSAMLANAQNGVPDDPGQLFAPAAMARRWLDASPTVATMDAVVHSLASTRKHLCLAWLQRNRAFAGWPHIPHLDNLALGRPAYQSSYSAWSSAPDCQRDAQGGNDGRLDGDFGFHTAFQDQPFWHVDLDRRVRLTGVWIFNRQDHWDRLRGFDVLISEDGATWQNAYRSTEEDVAPSPAPIRIALAGQARYLRIQLQEHTALHLREVMVFGDPL